VLVLNRYKSIVVEAEPYLVELVRYLQEYAAFARDRRTVDAVLRNIRVIGEAASRIPEAIQVASPEIPRADRCDMRNIVVYEYFSINQQILWDTTQTDLPSLDFSRVRSTVHWRIHLTVRHGVLGPLRAFAWSLSVIRGCVIRDRWRVSDRSFLGLPPLAQPPVDGAGAGHTDRSRVIASTPAAVPSGFRQENSTSRVSRRSASAA
jgi:uncharacterized protein with HEPN domain